MVESNSMETILTRYRQGGVSLSNATQEVLAMLDGIPLSSYLATLDRVNERAFLRLCLYELTYQKSIGLVPETAGKCEFDPVKVDQYISALSGVDIDLAEVVKGIIQRTTYLSFDAVQQLLQQAMESFILAIGDKPFAVVVYDNNRYGSEQWIIQLAWPLLRTLAIQGIYDYDELHSWTTSVWIDDAVYSGGNLMEILSQQALRRWAETGEAIGSVNQVPEIHLVLVAANRPTVQWQVDGEDGIINDSRIIPHVGLYVDPLGPPDSIDREPSLVNRFLWHELYQIALYFDHKVASVQSTYRFIYEGAVPTRSLTDEELHGDPAPGPGYQLGWLMRVEPSRRVVEVLEQYHKTL